MAEIPSSFDSPDDQFLENTWGDLLSRQPAQIRAAFQSLDPASQQIVLAHLTRMSNEAGWHPEQIQSARSALNVLRTRKS